MLRGLPSDSSVFAMILDKGYMVFNETIGHRGGEWGNSPESVLSEAEASKEGPGQLLGKAGANAKAFSHYLPLVCFQP